MFFLLVSAVLNPRTMVLDGFWGGCFLEPRPGVGRQGNSENVLDSILRGTQIT